MLDVCTASCLLHPLATTRVAPMTTEVRTAIDQLLTVVPVGGLLKLATSLLHPALNSFLRDCFLQKDEDTKRYQTMSNEHLGRYKNLESSIKESLDAAQGANTNYQASTYSLTCLEY